MEVLGSHVSSSYLTTSTVYVVVYITYPKDGDVKGFSKRLVEEKVAACVNIVSNVRSYYWWEGKVETGDEYLLVIKTKAELLSKLLDVVKEYHPYSIPEVIAVPIVAGNSSYLRWIDESLKSV